MPPPSTATIRLGGTAMAAAAAEAAAAAAAAAGTTSPPPSTDLVVEVASGSDLPTALASVRPASLAAIVIRVGTSDLAKGGCYSAMALAGLVPALQPGGTVQVRVLTDPAPASPAPSLASISSDGSGFGSGSGARDRDRDVPAGALVPVNDSFLLAGLSAESESRGTDGDADGAARILTARKKMNLGGKTRALNLGGGKGGRPWKARPLSLGNAIKINLDGDGDDSDDSDDGMIDEDALLSEENVPEGLLTPPSAVDTAARAAKDDCGGRKACDDCTCGRAEQEAMEKGDPAQAQAKRPEQVPSSACGNCSMGDAFRCAGCPYLGKPAFKPGEEHLVLDLADDL